MSNSEPVRRVIDQHAIGIPKESGLFPCLYVPVAARDMSALDNYVGKARKRKRSNCAASNLTDDQADFFVTPIHRGVVRNSANTVHLLTLRKN
jgi:hypothetical protein